MSVSFVTAASLCLKGKSKKTTNKWSLEWYYLVNKFLPHDRRTRPEELLLCRRLVRVPPPSSATRESRRRTSSTARPSSSKPP